jgi:branched-chain amino acid transport system substrate-binding protein
MLLLKLRYVFSNYKAHLLPADKSINGRVLMFSFKVISKLSMACVLFASFTLEAKEELIIGIDADFSAVAAEGGIAIQRGAQLAVSEINDNGGLLGRQVKLVPLDHRGNPARGVRNMKKFAETENLLAVIGGVHTPVALAELPVIHENNIIYLGTWAAGTSIVDNDYTPNFVFRASVRDAEAGAVLVKHAVSKKASRIGLVLERTAWGRSNLESIRKAAEANNIDIAHVAWINWRQTEFSEDMAKLVGSKPDAILLVSNAPEGSVVVKSLFHENKEIPVISHWGIAGGNFVDRTGIDTLQLMDISVLQTFSFASPRHCKKRSRVLESYRATFDENATEYSVKGAVGLAQAYDLVHMLAKAVKTANSQDRKVVRDALFAISEHEGLIKYYRNPFNQRYQDALLADDYFMTHFNSKGGLVPADTNPVKSSPN